jgi:hypothetical protein
MLSHGNSARRALRRVYGLLELPDANSLPNADRNSAANAYARTHSDTKSIAHTNADTASDSNADAGTQRRTVNRGHFIQTIVEMRRER